MSRVHARIVPTAAGLKVSDDASRHGTFVDGHPVSGAPVLAPPGSVLRFGNTILLVVTDPTRYESPPHRLSKDFTGLAHDMLAGPDTWKAWQQATQAGPLEHPVLILGESGVGKEVVARLIHLSRPRRGKFVAVNLAAIPDNLFEAELFGYERGAFTGAAGPRRGAFREAAGGTLFLDELGELRPALQVKLLRAVENKRIRPLGADGDVEADPRLVTATSRDLDVTADAGPLRRDLYFRLSGIVIAVPPLRERRDDILVLARERLEAEAPGVSLSATAAERLALAHWAGNVRELQHALTRAMLNTAAEGASQLLVHHLPELTVGPNPPERVLTEDSLRAAIVQTRGNATAAAKMLGVCRTAVYDFCARHELDLAALRSQARSPEGE